MSRLLRKIFLFIFSVLLIFNISSAYTVENGFTGEDINKLITLFNDINGTSYNAGTYFDDFTGYSLLVCGKTGNYLVIGLHQTYDSVNISSTTLYATTHTKPSGMYDFKTYRISTSGTVTSSTGYLISESRFVPNNAFLYSSSNSSEEYYVFDSLNIDVFHTISEVKSSVSDLQADVSTLKSDVSNLKIQQENLNGGIDEVNVHLSNIEQNQQQTNSTLNEINTGGTLGQSVSEKVTDIENLHNQVVDKQEQSTTDLQNIFNQYSQLFTISNNQLWLSTALGNLLMDFIGFLCLCIIFFLLNRVLNG